MQSPPATMAWTRVSSLPGAGRRRPVPEIDQPVGALLDPQPLHQRGGQQQPGASDHTLVVERDIDPAQHHLRG
jgi:hypothetical protein